MEPLRKKQTHQHGPAQVDVPQRYLPACVGCSAREEQLVFLREQVRTLQDKLLCLVPEAADRAHRMALTQVANMRPEAASGIVPLGDTLSEEGNMDQWLNGFMPQQPEQVRRGYGRP